MLCGSAVAVLQPKMAKKNKSNKSKNGTKSCCKRCHSTKTSAAASMPQQPSQRSQPSPRFVVKSRDPATAHANAVLKCYGATPATPQLPLPSAASSPHHHKSRALRANDAVLVAAVRSSTTTLVRAAGETPLASGTNASAIDRALLALDVECGTKIATTTSPRLKQVLAVFKEVSGTQARRAGGRVPPRKASEVPEGRGR